jgi:hypothetical protein
MCGPSSKTRCQVHKMEPKTPCSMYLCNYVNYENLYYWFRVGEGTFQHTSFDFRFTPARPGILLPFTTAKLSAFHLGSTSIQTPPPRFVFPPTPDWPDLRRRRPPRGCRPASCPPRGCQPANCLRSSSLPPDHHRSRPKPSRVPGGTGPLGEPVIPVEAQIGIPCSCLDPFIDTKLCRVVPAWRM